MLSACISVKFEMRGNRITATSISACICVSSKLDARESSSSISTSAYGTTPSTGLPARSSNIVIPGSKIFLSPRNLFTINPLIRSCSSGSKSITVPISCANTPPRSMSPTRSTGASAIFAIPIFTISSCFRLISAGLPAPSITMMS